MNSLKKYLRALILGSLGTIFSAHLQAGFSLRVVNFYPGRSPAEVNYEYGTNSFVWGVPKEGKPIMLASIPVGSEAELKWPSPLESIFFFGAEDSKGFENVVNRTGKDQAVKQFKGYANLRYSALDSAVGTFTFFDQANMPPSGSRIFLMPEMHNCRDFGCALLMNATTSIPQVSGYFANLLNLKKVPAEHVPRRWYDHMINWLATIKSKLKLLNISDPRLSSAMDTLNARYTDLRSKAKFN